jgi:hypothetical protein
MRILNGILLVTLCNVLCFLYSTHLIKTATHSIAAPYIRIPKIFTHFIALTNYYALGRLYPRHLSARVLSLVLLYVLGYVLFHPTGVCCDYITRNLMICTDHQILFG